MMCGWMMCLCAWVDDVCVCVHGWMIVCVHGWMMCVCVCAWVDDVSVCMGG